MVLLKTVSKYIMEAQRWVHILWAWTISVVSVSNFKKQQKCVNEGHRYIYWPPLFIDLLFMKFDKAISRLIKAVFGLWNLDFLSRKQIRYGNSLELWFTLKITIIRRRIEEEKNGKEKMSISYEMNIFHPADRLPLDWGLSSKHSWVMDSQLGLVAEGGVLSSPHRRANKMVSTIVYKVIRVIMFRQVH